VDDQQLNLVRQHARKSKGRQPKRRQWTPEQLNRLRPKKKASGLNRSK
jgi:hypothetical protein